MVMAGVSVHDGRVLGFFVADGIHPAEETIETLAHAAAEEDERDQEEGAEDAAYNSADLCGGETLRGGIDADDSAEAEVDV